MDEGINIKVVLNAKIMEQKEIETWLDFYHYFKPSYMLCRKLTRGEARRFNKNKLYKNLEAELMEDHVSISIEDHENSIWIHKNINDDGIMSLSCMLTKDIFVNNREHILSYLDQLMENKGLFAYVCSSEDWFWQNTENLYYYKVKGKSLRGVKTKKSRTFPDEDIVDAKYNPGYFHNVNGLMFGSCWMMWYGKGYFQYIPKPLLMSFKDCYENKQLSNDCIRITLYEDLWQYDKRKNRKRQWRFRRHVGLDEVAERLEEEAKNKPADDGNTSIEILEGEFAHGGIRWFKYYFDKENQVTPKSKAYKAVEYELGKNGEILWTNTEYFEHK